MTLNHTQELNNLLSFILSELADDNRYKTIVEYGPIEINAFSITFWVNFDGAYGTSSIYVKIPKIIFYDKSKNFDSPITEADKDLAHKEFDSLNYLKENWDDSLGVRFVQPIDFFEKYNAIITKRIQGKFLFKVLKKITFMSFLNKKDKQTMLLNLNNYGRSLRRFHNKETKASPFDLQELKKKFDSYLNFLEKEGSDVQFLRERLKELLQSQGIRDKINIVDNFKGIDIRQIFINEENNLEIIDPGKIKKGLPEIGIARFIVTCRILFSGTIWAFFRLSPSQVYEKSFLRGYFASQEVSRLVNLFIVKEFLKQWKISHQGLKARNWVKFSQYITRKFYLDPFYKSFIRATLKDMELI